MGLREAGRRLSFGHESAHSDKSDYAFFEQPSPLGISPERAAAFDEVGSSPLGQVLSAVLLGLPQREWEQVMAATEALCKTEGMQIGVTTVGTGAATAVCALQDFSAPLNG
eukprot:s2582_g9.t1